MTLTTKRSFESYEEFNAFPHGWDADFRVTTNQPYVATIAHTVAEGVLVNSGSYSQPTLQRASTPAGMRSLALPLYINGPMTWHHNEIDQQSLMLFGENRELFSASSAAMNIVTISIADDLFEHQLAEIQVADPQALRNCRVSQVTALQWQHLHKCLGTLTSFCEKQQHSEANPALERYLVEDTVYQFVNASLSKLDGGYRLPFNAAAKHVHRAMQYILPRLRTPLTVAEVCSDTGIGRRNLELSFHRYLGIPPKKFINQMRFTLCREQLQQLPSRKVSEIAQDCGFWHMGQFSRDYRAQFGELPSETLKRSQVKPGKPS